MLFVVIRDFVKFAIMASGLFIAGCSASDAESAKPQSAEAVAKTNAVQDAAVQAEPVRAPLNCPIMIAAYSHSYDKASADILNLSYEPYLSFKFQENPNFNAKKGDECNGDLKNLWPDLTRFDDEIETFMPNIKGGFNSEIILHNFPKTEHQLKNFIDQASKRQGLPQILDNIDRSTLEGGLDYNRKILNLIREQEKNYWQTVQTPVLSAILSKYGKIQFRPSSEKHAYCYHPHDLCRGYLRVRGTVERPESQIGNDSEYDLEYLWAAASYHFDLIKLDNSEN